MVKLWSKLGDREDIRRRKELATTAMNSNKDIWMKKRLTTLKTRVKLYETLVKSILLQFKYLGYVCNRREEHCQLPQETAQEMMGIRWPHRISNKKLYEKTNTLPISRTITERRWKLLGHILRLPAECPARRAMKYFFGKRTNRKFPGRKRTTIVTTINRDIKRTKQKHHTFLITPLISEVSLQNIHTKAKNRKLWAKIVQQVVDSAYSS